MLSVGDYVVKAGEGVCRIDSRITMTIPNVGTDIPYFVLIPLTDERAKVYLPEKTGHDTEVRTVMTETEARKLVDMICVIEPAVIVTEKSRETAYKEAIRSCDPEKLVAIIKHMYLRRLERQAQGKKNTAVDERYFAIAEKALYSEIGFVLNITTEDVKNMIIESAEKRG